MMHRCLLPLSLVTLVLVGAASADQIAQNKAKRVIEFNAEFIHPMAYLTVKHNSVEFDGTREFTDGSFEHHFTFRGTWEDQQGFFSMSFRFNSAGRLISLGNEGRSWLFEPFTTSGALLELVKETVLKEMLKDPELSDEAKANVRRFIDNGQVDKFVIAYLNHQNGFKD